MDDAHLLSTNDDSLWVGVDGVYGVAHWAFDVHEERVGGLNLPLQLVLGGLLGWVNVK